MPPYQHDIQHAAKSLIDAIFYEESELKELEKELQRLEHTLDDLAMRIDFLQRNPDLDDEGLATCMHWEARFDVAPKADDIATRIQDTKYCLAYEVIQLLGWSEIKQFNDDLESLLCPA